MVRTATGVFAAHPGPVCGASIRPAGHFSCRNRAGQPHCDGDRPARSVLTDLTREDFEVLEDGKPQTLQHFARGDDLETGPELHIGLLFDTSGSMDADIKMSRSAAIKFLNTMNYASDMTLVDFDTEVRVTKFSQHDFPRLVERIRSRKPEGFTAMYDALGVYLDGAADVTGGRSSSFSPTAATRAARSASATR